MPNGQRPSPIFLLPVLEKRGVEGYGWYECLKTKGNTGRHLGCVWAYPTPKGVWRTKALKARP